jgi:hypothetical protein
MLARVGSVERCWFPDRQNVQADSTLCLLEEIEPQLEVVAYDTLDSTNRVRRWERGVIEVADSAEEVPRGRDDEADVIETADKCAHPCAARRLAGDHFRYVC